MSELHLIEPTLFDQTGHGYSYTKSMLEAADQRFNLTLHLWLDKRGQDLFPKTLCQAHLFFYRKFRQVQKFFLYFSLLKKNTSLYICTSETIDFILLDFLCHSLQLSNNPIFLHFHQFTQKKHKLNTLQKIAHRNPNFFIFTPTIALSQLFKDHGFKHCHTLPCPTFMPATPKTHQAPSFQRLLYAGAARADKGFPTIINLLETLRKNNDLTPFSIQISPPNSNRYDHASTCALTQLKKLPKDNLVLYHTTLPEHTYQSVFKGAISLLLYDNQIYHNKFSGVALDAFYAGSPIITTPNTWIAETVLRFQAGLVLKNNTQAHLIESIQLIQNNYVDYSHRALLAQNTLKKEHDPKNTLSLVSDIIASTKTNRQK
jgi:glycosyltransferase involved in cell wall biosynthesis